MVFNGAQVHLLVNHLPVIGFLIAVLTLAATLLLESVDIKRFVLALTFFVGLSSLASYWTGEPAEEFVEHLPGFDKALIHAHEEAAEFATLLAVLTAIAAAGALFLQSRNTDTLRKTMPVVFVLSLITAAAMAKAAHEGGNIGHGEIRSKGAALPGPPE